jgi:hypothetical protein
MARCILAVALVLFTVGICHAGWLGDAVKSVVGDVGQRAVVGAVSGEYGGANGAGKDAVKGTDRSTENQPAPDTTQGAGSAPEMKPPAGDSIEHAENVSSK